MMASQRRSILGVAGLAGTGKSTFACALAQELGPEVAVVPMDGFHLANVELRRLGRAGRKGAPDTFDAASYLALLCRIRQAADEVIYAPAFDRELDEAVAGAIPIDPEVRLIITEGNYLLPAEELWNAVGTILDATWFVDVPEEQRCDQLLRRHMRFGRSREEALAWIKGTDDPKAQRVAGGAARAEYRVCWGNTSRLENAR